jgi:DNA-binding SARP family transcriptional activator
MLQVNTLGTTKISIDSFTIQPNSFRKFALLLRLAADAGRRVSRIALHELLFPNQSELNARHSLRESIYQFRRKGIVVDSDKDGLSIAREQVRFDFASPLAGKRLTKEELNACAGGFLPGYAPDISEAFSEWLDGFRAKTTFALCRALLAESRIAKEEGDWTKAEDAARACIAIESLNEEGILLLAEVLAVGGSKSQAVKLLDDYVSEVGTFGSELQVPAQILRRRISDRQDNVYTRPKANECRFIGRMLEMSALRKKYDQARGGCGSCVIVSGPAGIGKSRLTHEFLNGIAFDGARSIRVSLHAHDKHRPLSGVFEAITTLRKLPGALGCEPETLAVLDRVVGRGATVSDPAHRVELKPDRDAVIHAVVDLFCAVASETFFICWIDDAHWSDSATREAIAALSSRFRELRILLILTTREPRELLDGMRHSRDVLHIPLPPLNEKATLSLIDDALQSSPEFCSASKRWRMASTAAGNPLFALSLASHLQNNGEAFDIPKTLWDSFAHLIDGVSPASISVLATTIAFGRNATIERLMATLEMRHGELLESLVELADRDLITEVDGVVKPGHPLVAEVVRKKAAPIVLRFANARVAHHLRSDADSDPSLLWDSAECFVAAGNTREAFEALRSCAAQARAIGRPREAAQTLGRACRLAENSEELEATARDLVEVADSALESELVLEGVRHLRAAGVAHSHDDAELAELRCLMRTNRLNTELKIRLVDCTNATEASPAHRSKAALWLLKYADATGDDALIELAAETFSGQAGNSADAFDDVEFALIHASATNNFGAMAAAARSLIVAAESVPFSGRLAYLFNAAAGLLNAGETSEAVTLLEKIYESSSTTRGIQERLLAAAQLAAVFSDLDDEHQAVEWMNRAVEASRERGDTQPSFEITVLEIERAVASGQFEYANSLFRQAGADFAFCDGQIRERWGTAIDVRLRAELQLPSPSDQEYATAMAKSGARSMSGVRDFEIATACAVFIRSGQVGRAQTVLDEYLARDRTTRRDISMSLRKLGGLFCRDVTNDRRSTANRHSPRARLVATRQVK